jgi:hypothetical protein
LDPMLFLDRVHITCLAAELEVVVFQRSLVTASRNPVWNIQLSIVVPKSAEALKSHSGQNCLKYTLARKLPAVLVMPQRLGR